MGHRAFYKDAPDYCHYYFDLTPGTDLLHELETSRQETLSLIGEVPPDKVQHSYAPGKWTVMEVIRHIIDCERVYTYRALRFSRLDDTPLPGFSETSYIDNSRSAALLLAELKEEYDCVRRASIALFKTMTDGMLDFRGTANGAGFTARALGFMTVGHNLHHIHVLRSRYL